MKLKYDELLSNFACFDCFDFNCKLRHYNEGAFVWQKAYKAGGTEGEAREQGADRVSGYQQGYLLPPKTHPVRPGYATLPPLHQPRAT